MFAQSTTPQEALRGRLLRFKFRTALAESASIAAASDAARYLEGRNSTNTKIS